jgi:hypothetical protein
MYFMFLQNTQIITSKYMSHTSIVILDIKSYKHLEYVNGTKKPGKANKIEIIIVFEYIMASISNPSVVAYFPCFVRKVGLMVHICAYVNTF